MAWASGGEPAFLGELLLDPADDHASVESESVAARRLEVLIRHALRVPLELGDGFEIDLELRDQCFFRHFVARAQLDRVSANELVDDRLRDRLQLCLGDSHLEALLGPLASYQTGCSVCKVPANRDIPEGRMQAGVRKPAPLRPGDRIAVIAPSGGVDAERLAAGVAVLEQRGFPVTPPARREPFRLFSARDHERREELMAAFEDPDVRAVWFARGGYGMNRLLPDLDPGWIAAHPKLCVGFSDATAHLQWMVSAGVPALHGPMVAHDVVREAETGGLDHALGIAAGTPDWVVPVPQALVPGRADGTMLGGCLAVLLSLAGTPYQPSFQGRIALLEDTHERPQRKLDRMLIQLRQAGMIAGARGVVFGTMPECGPEHEIRETILDCLGDLGVPIGFGAPVGHGDRHLAVPMGVSARLSLDADGGRLEGLESMVA